MSVNPEIRRELSDLLGRLRDGQSDAADLARLDAMVSGDPAVCALYQDYVNLFASLHWARVDQAVLRNAAGPRSPEEQKVSCGEEGEAPGWASGSCQSAGVSPDPVSAVVHRLPSSLGGSSALPWCHGSVLLSYLAAALIFGSGSLAAWKWNAADPVRASGLRGVAALPAMATTAGRTIVGRVTRTADCRLANANVVRVGEAVALGRKYSLVSGALEIAYASGPTVTLQGPATFEVDSPTGGFLHVGELAFRAGKKPKHADRPIFCIHTPLKGPPDAHHSIQTRDTDLTVTIDGSGGALVRTRVPAIFSASTGSGSSPLETVILPDNPSVAVGVNESHTPRIAVQRDKPPAAVAGQKRERSPGYAQEPRREKKTAETPSADRDKS